MLGITREAYSRGGTQARGALCRRLSAQPVRAAAKEIEQAEVPEDLELLADLVADVGVLGVEFESLIITASPVKRLSNKDSRPERIFARRTSRPNFEFPISIFVFVVVAGRSSGRRFSKS